MVLPTGTISLTDIRDEMNNGATGAIGLGSYYSSGSTYVRGVTGIPTSGTIGMNSFRGKKKIPVSSGMIAKYTGESYDGTNWNDETGNGYTPTKGGTINISTQTSFNSMKCLYGGINDSFTFPSGVLPTTYTLFHITRYNGGNRTRIVTGVYGGTNWLSGHWGGSQSVAYHGDSTGWVTGSSINNYGQIWMLSTDQNGLYRGNQYDRTTNTSGSSCQLTVNGYTGEKSDWAIFCVIVYNRTLSSSEILSMESYLMDMYSIPRVTNYNWYSVFSKSEQGGYAITQAGTDPNVQWQLNSSSVYGNVNNIYRYERIQDNTTFQVDFEIYITSTSGADGMWFYFGSTSPPGTETSPSNGIMIDFQVYQYGGLARGLYLFTGSGTNSGSYATSAHIASAWKAVRVIYTQGTSNTVQVWFDGTNVINWSNASDSTWRSSTSGYYWGFGSRVGGVSGDYYVRKISLSMS
jgi:hypothetical protein